MSASRGVNRALSIVALGLTLVLGPPRVFAFSDDASIRKAIIRESIESYSGSCPCPYNKDRAGRKCGKRSAHSKPGGAAPICFDGDVTDDMISRYLQTH
jgi:hypothetical protein